MARQLYKIIDGSWSLRDRQDGEKMDSGFGLDLKNRQFKLLAQGCDLPASVDDKRNSVIMRDVKNGDIVFTNMRFVVPHPTFCPTCGSKL